MDVGGAMKEKPQILIVDDLVLNSRILSEILKNEGFDISIASGGEDALQFLNTHPCDLVLMDIQMPDMDGLEVCRIMKNQAHTQSVPVIFLTALSETNEVLQGFEAGGVDYVLKPFNLPELKARVRTQVNLRLAMKKITETNRDLEQLIYTVSHDLKAPLHSIMGYSQYISKDLLENKPQDRIQNDAVRIYEIAAKATAFVGDLLNLSRASLKDVQVSQFPMQLLVEDVLKDLMPSLEKAQGTTIFSGEWGLVSTDKDRIREIWQNLIQNALKYRSPDRNLELIFQAAQRDQEYTFSLTDNGIGIAGENLPRLFTLFEKVDEKTEGSGVGLAIVKKILTRLGGTVEVTSPGKDQGSTFSFTLPV